MDKNTKVLNLAFFIFTFFKWILKLCSLAVSATDFTVLLRLEFYCSEVLHILLLYKLPVLLGEKVSLKYVKQLEEVKLDSQLVANPLFMKIPQEWQHLRSDFHTFAGLHTLCRLNLGSILSKRGASYESVPGNGLGYLITMSWSFFSKTQSFFFRVSSLLQMHVSTEHQIWTELVWRGWQEALLPLPVWKCDVLFMLKAGWRWVGAERIFLTFFYIV